MENGDLFMLPCLHYNLIPLGFLMGKCFKQQGLHNMHKRFRYWIATVLTVNKYSVNFQQLKVLSNR